MINKLFGTTLLAIGILSISTATYAQETAAHKEPIANAQEGSDVALFSFIQNIWRDSPIMQEAETQVSLAKAQYKAASKWLYNPEIEFGLEDTDGADKSKIVGISQTIDWSGKYLASQKVGQLSLQAAIAKRDKVKQDLAINTLSALSDYQSSMAIMNLSAQRTEIMKSFAELAQKSFKAGDIDQSSYNLAQLSYSGALIQSADAQTNLAYNKQILESAIGFSDKSINTLPLLPKKLPKILDNGDDIDELVGNLPEMRMLISQKKASEAAIIRAKRDKIPDPTIGISGGKNEGDNVIGISLSIPLNIFNNYSNEVDIAKYQTIAQEKYIQGFYHSAQSRIKSSKKSYELASSAWNIWLNNGANTLANQIDILYKKYQVGELSVTDYLVQVQQSLDTSIAAEELYAKAWKSWFAWLLASGDIENWL